MLRPCRCMAKNALYPNWPIFQAWDVDECLLALRRGTSSSFADFCFIRCLFGELPFAREKRPRLHNGEGPAASETIAECCLAFTQLGYRCACMFIFDN